MKVSIKQKEKVIITDPFDGKCVSYINKEGEIYGSGESSLKNFKSSFTGKLRAISWPEFYKLHDEFYTTKFERIKKKQYHQALSDKDGYLKYSTLIYRYDIFFSAAPYTEDSGIHHILYLYDRRNGLYYKAIKSLSLSNKQIILEIEGEL